jgi:hypothetical protein
MDRENLPNRIPAPGQSSIEGGQAALAGGSGMVGRRSFLKGLGIVGATLLPARVLMIADAKAQEKTRSGSLTKGDADLLRFAAWAEIVESDLWVQYNELGGATTPNRRKSSLHRGSAKSRWRHAAVHYRQYRR